MPRTSLIFMLSSAQVRADLMLELSLHDEVRTSCDDSADSPRLTIDCDDSPHAVWDVRSTVKLFDPDALEVGA